MRGSGGLFLERSIEIRMSFARVYRRPGSARDKVNRLQDDGGRQPGADLSARHSAIVSQSRELRRKTRDMMGLVDATGRVEMENLWVTSRKMDRNCPTAPISLGSAAAKS